MQAVFPAYINALAGKGVKFFYKNVPTASCSRDGKTGEMWITLPLLPLEMTPEQLNLYLGLALHELEHFVDTNFDWGDLNPHEESFLGVFEDIRIESGIINKYAGGQEILNGMAAELGRIGFYTKPDNIPPLAALEQFMLHHMNVRFLGQPLKEYRDHYEASFEMHFDKPFKEGVREIIDKAPLMGCTEDAVKLSREVYALLDAQGQDSQDQDSQSQDSQDQDSQDQDSQDQDSQSQDSQSQDSQSQDSQSQDSQSQDSQSQDSQSQDSQSQDSQSQDSQGQDSQGQDQGAALALQDTPSCPSEAKSSVMSSEASSDTGLKIENTVHDSLLFSNTPSQCLIDEALSQSSALSGQLERLLQNKNAQGGLRSARSGSRLNRRAASAIAIKDISRNLYRKKSKGKDTFSDVHLLIDCSGSMDSRDQNGVTLIDVAIKSAMAMMSGMHRLKNVNVGVSAFTDLSSGNHHYAWDSSKPLKEGLETLSSINRHAMGLTPLGEGLVGAIGMMALNQKSDNRVLFVIQDGDGYGRKVQQAIETAKNNDIKIVGIGVQHTLPLGMYDYSIRIDDVADLSGELFSLLRTELVA
jgi:hypothetical protein